MKIYTGKPLRIDYYPKSEEIVDNTMDTQVDEIEEKEGYIDANENILVDEDMNEDKNIELEKELEEIFKLKLDENLKEVLQLKIFEKLKDGLQIEALGDKLEEGLQLEILDDESLIEE